MRGKAGLFSLVRDDGLFKGEDSVGRLAHLDNSATFPKRGCVETRLLKDEPKELSTSEEELGDAVPHWFQTRQQTPNTASRLLTFT